MLGRRVNPLDRLLHLLAFGRHHVDAGLLGVREEILIPHGSGEGGAQILICSAGTPGGAR